MYRRRTTPWTNRAGTLCWPRSPRGHKDLVPRPLPRSRGGLLQIRFTCTINCMFCKAKVELYPTTSSTRTSFSILAATNLVKALAHNVLTNFSLSLSLLIWDHYGRRTGYHLPLWADKYDSISYRYVGGQLTSPHRTYRALISSWTVLE